MADYPVIKIYGNSFCSRTLTAGISVSGDVCPTKGKRAIVTDLLTNYPQHESWAIGDSEHDEEMFAVVDKHLKIVCPKNKPAYYESVICKL